MAGEIGSIEAAALFSQPEEMEVACERCGVGHLRPARIRTAFWQGDGGLVILQGIPAMTCSACGEDYLDDATAVALDRLRGDGFRTLSVVQEMTVPVFDFGFDFDGEG